MNFFPLIPEQASTYAPRVDLLFYVLCIMSTILTVGIVAALLIIGFKYRWKEGEERESHALENPLLEITWTVVPTIVFLGVFVWATILYADYLRIPEGATEIDVVGKQWMWKIQHADGMREVNELHVPVDTPIALTMTSQDVLHAYYVPAFRVKQDVIPGRFTKLWFEATKTGQYPIFCAEYCGTEHSLMKGTVTVLSQDEYVQWLEGGPKKSPVAAGEFLFSQRGCATCHNDKADSRGPDMNGVFGSDVELTGGLSRLADEDYIRESILEPSRYIVKGYTPLMPSFTGQLSDEDVFNLIAYIKSIGASDTSEGDE